MAANTSALVYGGDFMLFLASSTGATQVPIAFSTSAKLTINMKTREASSKDSGNWVDKLPGKLDWNVSTDALYSDGTLTGSSGYQTLYGYMVARSGMTMAFAQKSGTTQQWALDGSKNYFHGTVYITSLDVSSPDGEQVTFTMSAEGSGELLYD